MSLIKELKRRNVFKVGAAYAVLAWILIQIIVSVLPVFGAPTWIVQTLIFIILVGFPISVFLAWAFELTPEGIKPTQDVQPGKSIAKATGQKLNRFVIVVLVLALGFVVVDSYILDFDQDREEAIVEAREENGIAIADQSTSAATPETNNSELLEKSIAVLPFVNLSSDPEQEYFSDGLSEELLNKLVKVQDLLVVARTSSFYFKGRNEDLRDIGEQLDVNYLLEGSVRKSGDSLRITAQLIQANNGYHLWSETYDRTLDDVFTIQDEIAIEVTRALSISLGAGEFDIPGATRNVAAYDARMKAEGLVGESAEILLQRISLMKEALTLDPDYADAWLSLSFMYTRDRLFPPGQVSEFPALSAEAEANAIRLAPGMPDVKVLLAERAKENGNWIEADRLMTELLEEYGNSYSSGVSDYAWLLYSTGRAADSVPYAERALRLDPRNGQAVQSLVNALIANEEYDLAKAEIENHVSLYSDYFYAQALWAIPTVQNDIPEYARQVRAYYNSDAYTGTEPYSKEFMMISLDLLELNDKEQALQQIEEIIASGKYTAIELSQLQGVMVLYGDFSMIPELLNRQYVLGTAWWQAHASEFRTTDYFKEWLTEAGIVDYWISSGNWADKCRPLPDSETDFECF